MTTVTREYLLTVTPSARGLVASINPDWPAMTISGPGSNPGNVAAVDGAYAQALQEVTPAGSGLGTSIGPAQQLRFDLAGQEDIPPGVTLSWLRVSSVARYRYNAGVSSATSWSNVRIYDGATDLIGPGVFSILDGPGSSAPAFGAVRNQDIFISSLAGAQLSPDLNVVIQPDEATRVVAGVSRYTRNILELDYLAFTMIGSEEVSAGRFPLRQRQRDHGGPFPLSARGRQEMWPLRARQRGDF